MRVVDIALPVDLKTIKKRNDTSYILDADIQGFFDHIDHEWAVKFVESRIKDPNIIRLLRRMLKAGIMKDYTYEETESNCRKRGKKPETFTFLGFTHYCSKSRNGRFRVKRKTSRKKFSKKCKEVHKLIGEMRTLPIKDGEDLCQYL